MKFTITVKLEPETQDELPALSEVLAAHQQHLSNLKKKGSFGSPEQVSIRYVVVNDRLQTITVPEIVPAERIPSVE